MLDASLNSYEGATNIKLTNYRVEVHCSFVVGKSRVAQTFLRQELGLNIDKSLCWSYTTARFQTFVDNRRSVIHEGPDMENWNYVNTKINPADLASRGVAIDRDVWLNQ